MKKARILHHLKKHFGFYYRAVPLIVLTLVVLGLGVQAEHPFRSVEVAFTDAAPSGLSIVPASCASSPQTPDTGSCACGPQPTQTCSNSIEVTGGEGNGRGEQQECVAYTYSCPAGYTYDGSWCVVTGSACDAGTPKMTLSAQYPTIQVGQSDDIHGTYAAGTGDSLMATYINEIPTAAVNNGAEFIALSSGYGQTNPNVQPTLDYSFVPTAPGTYIFLPYVMTQNYTTVQTLDSTQWVTVVVTAATALTCPNGSAAPNNDPSQCACTQGNTSACNNNSNQCPAGDTGTYPNCNATVCQAGYVSQSGQCAYVGCPAGYTLQNDECVFTQCPAGYTENAQGQCVIQQCTKQYLCGPNGNLYLEDTSCNISTSPVQICSYGCEDNECKAPAAPQIVTFKASPILVQSGKLTNVTWDVINATDCSVKGSNGDGSWAGLSGTQSSSQITAQTVYTLHCSVIPGAENPDGSPAAWVDRQVTVNVVPGFNEN